MTRENEKTITFKASKQELLAKIKNRKELYNVETNVDGDYTAVNVELYPSGETLTYAEINTKLLNPIFVNNLSSELNEYFEANV